MTPDNRSPTRTQLVSRGIRLGLQIVLVIVITLLLIAVFIPKFSSDPRGAKLYFAKLDLSNLQSALAAFAKDTGRYPTPTEGLNALLENPGLPTWQGPYIKKPPIDPWGNPYNYTPPSAPPTLSSDGPDSLPNTPDDIKNP